MAGVDDLVSMIRMLIAEQIGHLNNGRYGVVVGGSWDPTQGTVDVVDGLTATLTDGEVESPVVQKGVPVLVPYVGQQSGPVGGERCVLMPLYGGYVALLHHGDDDAPQAPAGEWWAQRHDPNTPPSQQKSFVRIQNDGATRIGGQNKVAAISERVELGQENLGDPNALMRKQDGQQLANDILSAVQAAFDNLSSRIMGGSGVGPPSVDSVTAQGSDTSYSI